ncbi:MAG: DUF4339 domain-containing protein [Serratia proteamaculans]
MNATEWFYEKHGQRHGPFSEAHLSALLENGTLDALTLVWQADMPAWSPAGSSPLAVHLPRNTPPPLPGHTISNTVVWVLALAPLLGFMLEAFIAGMVYGNEDSAMEAVFNGQFFYITLILNIALSYGDERNLKKAGIDTRGYGKLAWLVPVYLWKRARALSQTPAYVWVWLATFSLVIVASL